MPIRPDLKPLYPANWPQLSLALKQAAGWRCEGSPAYPDCRARHNHPHPVTGSTVILTVAHLDHNPANNDRGNLRVWCQRCHNTYDAPHRTRNAWLTRARKRGQLIFASFKNRYFWKEESTNEQTKE